MTNEIKNSTATMWYLYLIRLESGHLYTGIQLLADEKELSNSQPLSDSNSQAARKGKRRLDAERRKELKPLRDKVKKLEQAMEKLQIMAP